MPPPTAIQIEQEYTLLKPERDYVTSNPTLPDPASSLYLTISKQKNADESEDHLISGMQVVFNPASDENGLYHSYHIDPAANKQPDEYSPIGKVKHLTICADELVIYGELCLPETDLTVFARKLTFLAQGGKPGRISTSPLPYANTQAAQEASGKGLDGLNGRKAGNITLYANHLETDDPLAKRFILRGGKGQNPGAGRNGTDGASVPYNQLWSQYTFGASFVFGSDSLTYWFDPPASSIHRIDKAGFSWGVSEHDDWYGTTLAPTDGTNALPAGKPGSGGAGGDFTGVFHSRVFQAATFAADAEVAEAAAQKVPPVLSFTQTALGHAAALESLAKRFDPETFMPELKLVKEYLTLAEKALRSAQQVVEARTPALAVLFAEPKDCLQRAQKKTADFMAGRIPYERRSELIALTAQQIKQAIELAMAGIPQSVEKLRQAGGIVDTAGEISCAPGQDYTGGTRGWPDRCGQWFIQYVNDGFAKINRDKQELTKTITTKNGQNAPAPQADQPKGMEGKCDTHTVEEFGNAWLHPLLLQTLLIYIRDAYLAAPGQMDALASVLHEYRAALQALPPITAFQPIIEKTGLRYDESVFMQSLAEILSLVHRIDSHLDYFENPSGWTPLFSLPVCLQMYKNEVDEGLKSLVLARWIEVKAAQQKESAHIASQSIDSLNQDTDRTLKQLEAEKENLKKLREQAEALQKEITSFDIQLDIKRTELKNKARDDARQAAMLKLGVSTLNGICQVIPYGQPALGSLASAGSTIANNVIDNEDPLKAVGPVSNVLGDFIKSSLDSKAAELVEAAKKDKKEQTKEEKEQAEKEKAAQATADKLTHVGKTIGPALSDIAKGIQGLNVPESEVDARLKKLEAESPEFKELSQKLEALNLRKAEFFQRLTEGFQALTTAYAQVASNLVGVSAMQRQQRASLRVLDHQALLFNKQMNQNARLRLVKYLYYLAKCYEYAMLEPVEVNYQLDRIFDKITLLLQGDNFTGSVTDLANDLSPIFKEELAKIEEKLKDGFKSEFTSTMQIRLSAEQTPEIIAQLNASGVALLNLRDFNCILPRAEKVKINDIEVESPEFEMDGKPLPKSGTVNFLLEPMGDGTMRSGNRLYVVRHPTSASSAHVGPDSQQVWGLTYLFGGKQQERKIAPSKESLELLNSLLGGTNREIQEKIAKPAAWTELKVTFERLARGLPDLKSVILNLSLNWTPADANYCALDVRMSGRYAPMLSCSPADTNGRGNGYGSIYRIYPMYTAVELSAPPFYGSKAFSHWEVIDNTETMKMREVSGPVLQIPRLDYNMQVVCVYQDSLPLDTAVHEQHPLVQAFITEHFASPPSAVEAASFVESKEFKQFQKKLPKMLAKEEEKLFHGWSGTIFDQPEGKPAGYLPPKASFAVLEPARTVKSKKWQKIDYRGTVGWVSK